jgi:hypothetical protein
MSIQTVKINLVRVITSILLLMAGLAVYWLFQPNIYLFSIFQISNANPISADNLWLLFLKNHFADMAWCLALIQIFNILKSFKVSYYYSIILLLLPFLSEVLQAIKVIPGTGDLKDITVYLSIYIFFFNKEMLTMREISKHIIGGLAIVTLSIAIIGSGSTPVKPIEYIDGVFTVKPVGDEIFTKPSLSEIVKSSSKLSIVLRVPAPATEKEVTAQEKNASLTGESGEQNSIYNTIEKEFAKAGFVVRDRALFSKVLDQETLDYSKIEQITQTDLILEILNIKTNVPCKTKSYKDTNGIMQETPVDITFNGALVEFKLVSVKENDMVGSYSFNYVPCLEGCKHTFSLDSRATRTLVKYEAIPNEFWVNSAKRLIQEIIKK